MSVQTKAGALTGALKSRLETISQVSGYFTDVKRVYGPSETPADKASLPFILIRPRLDQRTGHADLQATRQRQYEIEVVFSRTVSEEQLCEAHVDLLRALGFGRAPEAEQAFALLAEPDELSFNWAEQGSTRTSITLTLDVVYVESYN